MAEATSESTAKRPATPGNQRNHANTKKNVLKWVKRALGLAFLGAVVAMLVVAWMPKPVAVDAAEAEMGELRVTVDEDGRTRVKDRHVISSPLTGSLARIELDPGDTVERGDVVARIVPLDPPLLDERSRAQSQARVAAAQASVRQARAAIERARAGFELAETEAARQRQLAQRGSVAEAAAERAEAELRARREELTSAQFAARVAEYEKEMAEAALGRLQGNPTAGSEEQLELKAPVDGRVLRVIQESEGVVQPGTPLLEVGDPQALEIVVDVLTSDAVDIEPGDRVRIERWGGDHPLEGRVRMVEPSAFTRVSALGVEEQRVNVVIDLVSPHEAWEELGDGYRVETRIVIWEADDVLTVPSSAVFRHEDGWAVFAVRDGVASLAPVEMGRDSGLEAQILDGLEPGDTVIVHPSDRVADGTEVTVRSREG